MRTNRINPSRQGGEQGQGGRRARAALAFWLATLTGPLAMAGPITTDRPDFVESAETVGAGRAQIETSGLWERSESDGSTTRQRSTPTLLRLGVGEDWEVRLESEGRMRTQGSSGSGNAAEAGWADASVGLKWHMLDANGLQPSLGWLLHADLASGSHNFRGQGTRPSLRAVMEWELAERWSFGAMPGLAVERAEGERHVSGSLGLMLGRQLSERWRVLGELALPRIATARNGGNEAFLNFAVAWLLSNDTQLDLSAQRGLNERSVGRGGGVGLSMRF
ncbi:hypothetical protein CKO20_10945 [Rhodocyclus tenuis]|nr:hypothetical protein [Rhodocyclus tenuis]